MPWIRTLLLCLPLLWLSACSDDKPTFHAMDFSQVEYAQDWNMPDENGDYKSVADYAGKVVYVFFGFAHCPDVCPTTMVEMAEVKEKLGEDFDKLQILFVTVDPERDTPEVMRAYLDSFDPSAQALIGSPDEVENMAKDFKVFYQRVPGPTPDSYTMDHSAGAYVYDPKGKLRLYINYGTPVDNIVDDIQLLIDGK
ncbi:SCO family protein [Paenalcaligenes sp. Me131]|uniref:SCO family protein n=1 Tax=Paenalcaligenes sp. Me131 TaxID=3392636 RepID=UPI003D27767C